MTVEPHEITEGDDHSSLQADAGLTPERVYAAVVAALGANLVAGGPHHYVRLQAARQAAELLGLNAPKQVEGDLTLRAMLEGIADEGQGRGHQGGGGDDGKA